MAKGRSRKLLEADKFRATVTALMRLSDVDWTNWEEKWLRDESLRPDDYIYTDTEREILNQLIAVSRPFTHYSSYSVQELLLPTYSYRAEFDLDDEEFLVELYESNATSLTVRRISRLADLFRCNEQLEPDELIDDTLRATHARDASLHDVAEDDWFKRVA